MNIALPVEVYAGARSHLLIGFCFGLMSFFVIHNSMLYVSLRERAHLFYVLVVAGLMLLLATLEGFTFELLQAVGAPDPERWFRAALYATTPCILAFLTLFLRAVLETRDRLPTVDRVLRGLIIADVALLVTTEVGLLFEVTSLSQALTPPLGAAHSVAVIALLGWAALHRSRPARMYLLGSVALMAGAWMQTERDSLGWLPAGLAAYAMYYGAVAQMLLLSLGLAQRVSQMHEEQRRQREQLLAADKLTSLGTMAAGVVHDIANPNGAVRSNVAFLQATSAAVLDALEDAVPADRRVASLQLDQLRAKTEAALGGVRRSADRIAASIEQLRGFYRRTSDGARTNVNVRSLVENAVRLAEHFGDGTAPLELALAPVPEVRANAQELEQAVLNLIDNARQATSAAASTGPVRVSTAVAPSGQIEISVTDSGAGMSAETREHAMRPFFTTREKSGGTGLGLYVVQRVITEHGGTLRLDSPPGGGTQACILLPAAEPG